MRLKSLLAGLIGLMIPALLLVLVGLAFGQPIEIAPPGGPIDGTKSCSSSPATIVTAPLKVVAGIICNADATNSVKVGDSSPALTLGPGKCLAFDTADLGLWYCERVGGSDVTVQWVGTRAK